MWLTNGKMLYIMKRLCHDWIREEEINMKKTAIVVAVCLLLALLIGCQNGKGDQESTTAGQTNGETTVHTDNGGDSSEPGSSEQTEAPTAEQTTGGTAEETTEKNTEEETTVSTVNDGPIEVGKYDQFDLDTYMRPLWEGRVVHNETVMFIDKGDQKTLLYTPDEILSVRSYDLKTEYVKGKDYDLVDGKLVLLEGSAIPCITREVYYGAGSDSYLKTKDPDGKDVFTYWGEGTAMVKWQVAVTYTHSQFWQDFRQESAADTYLALISKLEKGEDATVIFYGDSITFGANASSQIGCEPYAPTWTQMAVQYLAKHYGYTVRYIDPKLSNVARVPEDSRFGERGTITYINTSVGGWTSQNGIDNFNTYVKPYIEQYGCDLFAVAYGMNDAGVAPANEKKQIKKITDAVLSVKSDAALMIVATMVPNPNATNGWYGNQHRFETQLLKLASEYRDAGVPCAVMRMTSVSKAVLQHKDFVDYTGNNINHPNDFMVRLYAQTFVQTLVGYENLKAD